MITVKTLNNGQRVATKGNLQIVQTKINGRRFNDCSVNHGGHSEIVSSADERFRDLFIALSQQI